MTRRLGKTRIVGIVVAAGIAGATLLPPGAFAVENGDALAGRGAIAAQIEAFRHDDAAASFDYAAPGIQQIFPTADAFLAMVRQAYRPVYRPRSYSFGAVRDTEGGFDQSVDIQDEDGVDWTAVYSFERQPDGTWKISGCSLVKAPGTSV